jgi:hypothetical protein
LLGDWLIRHKICFMAAKLGYFERYVGWLIG